MTKFRFLSVLLAGLLLGGCASTEEPAGPAAPPAGERAAVVITPPAGSGPTVETHALPPAGSGDGTAMAATSTPLDGTGVSGLTPQQAAMLRDPKSPLSKRVVYFDFDSDVIKDEFRGLIEAHSGFLKQHRAVRIILQGHTDERGSRDYNLALGQRRAESVKRAMGLLGVQDAQVETVSLGEEKPVDEGHNEAAWRLNRRAEIHYVGE
ncbi:MAG: peptidoglycan-associated lipoprotein Pal [Gallionellaceae bacterium]|nr:peptidoglycan-associated lipoprotein Pal [Gallionellaceae bacterium]